jgi:glycosyltransferase involved in cell wall biosynthesis
MSEHAMHDGATHVATAAKLWPKISLVTPVWNSGKYIEQTIRSVLAQGYPNLEYFIVDGGSTDGTLDIIPKYEKQISGWMSEPDKGMYDALNKGYARTTGDIMGWISATDMLHVGGLSVVGSVFRDFPEVEWITSRATNFNDEGMTVNVLDIPHWSRYRFLAGANKYIQQESTFWRRSLWDKAGGHLDSSRRMSGDFELWVRFFRHAPLYTVDALIGGFRMHSASLSVQQVDECHRIQQEVVDAELDRYDAPRSLRAFRRLHRAIYHIPKVRNWWNRYVVGGLHHAFYHWQAADCPPVIEYRGDRWRFRP